MGEEKMIILVTGGLGFIGSNFIRHMLSTYPDCAIINLDLATYAGNPENLRDIADDPRYRYVYGDICDFALVDSIFAENAIDSIVHFAAESHVDRSIADASVFVRTNVLGTHTLLEAALKHGLSRFIHVSTDEVYGSIMDGSFGENDNLNPSSPYSASKAGSDLLALSYWITHRLPVIVTRCTNNFGPYQFPEKLIPLFATNLIDTKKVPVYGTGKNVRDWIYVLDHCKAIDLLLSAGTPGEVYNIGSGNEKNNIDITMAILGILGFDESRIEYVEDRKGHDWRYSLDSTKLRGMGWAPEYDFATALQKTVEWYAENEWWWRPLKQ